MKSIEAQLDELESKKQLLLEQLKTKRSNQLFRCVCCNKLHKFKTCDGLLTHYYVAPYGCSYGDYWEESGLWIICPTTGIANRLLFNNCDVAYEHRKKYENNPEAQFKKMYIPVLKRVKNVYRDNEVPYINTDWFDQNRKRYGLVEKRNG